MHNTLVANEEVVTHWTKWQHKLAMLTCHQASWKVVRRSFENSEQDDSKHKRHYFPNLFLEVTILKIPSTNIFLGLKNLVHYQCSWHVNWSANIEGQAYSILQAKTIHIYLKWWWQITSNESDTKLTRSWWIYRSTNLSYCNKTVTLLGPGFTTMVFYWREISKSIGTNTIDSYRTVLLEWCTVRTGLR